MSGTLRVTILGCGSSGGVPRADGAWGACDPNEPRNRRSRCGMLLQKWRGGPGDPADATTVLIDTSPDLRTQMMTTGVKHIDAVLFSHDHADQTHGLDDLRVYALLKRRRVSVFMDALTRETLTRRFDYCFVMRGGYPPILEDAGDLRHREPVRVDGPGGALEAIPLDQDHGGMPSLGFRVGAFGYSNDVVRLPGHTLAALRGLDVWVVDALRYTTHPTHAHLEQTLAWIADIRPNRAILTNMHIDLDYRRLAAELPAGVEPAHDGLAFDIAL
ncbi:MAG: MBL fold metallo-hydrolase [Alphaproteobacteria bacterium]|nr:MBL fold metallo-hydrolase [Alphaproteobacteria bacterium]